jgi:chromosome segregation ATPase
MNKVVRSLRGVVQDTLHKSKINSMYARLKASDAASLNDAMEELEKILADRIGNMKAAVTEGQAVVADEAKHAEHVIQSLRANIAVLAAKLRETEDTVRRKDVESQKMQETLNTKIGLEESLERRYSEVKDLTSKVDVLEKQVTDLEFAIQQATEQAAREALRADSVSETSQVRIDTLEAQLRNTEEIVARRDAATKALEEDLTAKIHGLESQVRDKETLLAEQIRQLTDLKSELQRLTIKERSSLSGEAGALADSESGRAVVNEQLKTEEEKPATFDFQNGEVTSHVTDADRQTVSAEVFYRITDGLFEVTDIMRPMAYLIVRNHIESLGESIEDFPQTRLTELLEAVSREISDDKLRTAFRQRLGKL